METILMSIKPKYCELIASGKKTIEVRKTRPKIKPPFRVCMYCTKASKQYQTVCGSMVMNDDELYRLPTGEIKYGNSLELLGAYSGEYNEDNFLNGKVIGEFICDEVSGGFWVPPFSDKMQERSCLTYEEARAYAYGKPLVCMSISECGIYDKPKELTEFNLTRAPQSWCYVESELNK